MTDSVKVQELKNTIKIVIGEKEYVKFLSRLAGGIEPLKNIAKAYGLDSSTVSRWANGLGYRDAKTKQALRGYYRRLERIKEREKKTKKLMEYLFKVNGK